LRLVSTNEKYSDKFAPFTEEPRIIGKVVASFTPLEK
jgi:phage repressor protein C with HTH and peptisase S24 domain